MTYVDQIEDEITELTGRIIALEHRWEIYKVHAEALGAQLARIEALERALAKQREVNKALLKWITESIKHQDIGPNLSAVIHALREAE